MRRTGNSSPPPSSRSKVSSLVAQNYSGLFDLETIKKDLTKYIQQELAKTFKTTITSIMTQDANSFVLSDTSLLVQNPSRSVTKSKNSKEKDRLSGVHYIASSKKKVDVDSFRKNFRSQTKFIPKLSKSQTKIARPFPTVQKLENKLSNLYEKNQAKTSLHEIIQKHKSQQEVNVPISKSNVPPKNTNPLFEDKKETKTNEKLISDFLNAYNQLKAGINDESFLGDFKQILKKLNVKDSNREINDFTIGSFEDLLSLKQVDKWQENDQNLCEISFSKDNNMIHSNRDFPTTIFNSEKKCRETQNRSFSSDSDEVLTDMERAHKLNRMIIRRETGKEALERRDSLIKNLGLAFTFEKKRQPINEGCEETKEALPFF